MGLMRVAALCAALCARAAAWCPPPHVGPPSGAAVISVIHGAPRPRRHVVTVYSPYVARFVWWHVAVMGFERVHLVVFHNASVAAPTAVDVYGASSCVAAWVASGGLSWEARPYVPVHHAGFNLYEAVPLDWNAGPKSGAIAETYAGIRAKYDWVAVLDIDELFFANASAPAAPRAAAAAAAAPHGLGAKKAPVLAAIEASVRALAPLRPAAPQADVFKGVGSLCAPGFSFVNAGPRNLPSLRSAEVTAYGFNAVPAPAGSQAHCWKSMHRTAAVTHLTSPYAMHTGPGVSKRVKRGPGALAVAHLARWKPPQDEKATAIDASLVQFAQRLQPRVRANRRGGGAALREG
ncbi:hypothetical protein M885DRAFT_624743 [Pelagophyceae sp. CCMP2097]|nr:hypothetical protein M885DRAFT_624743 [Pelagophyceae sp. CCMP2097]